MSKAGVVIEFKKAYDSTPAHLEEAADEALAQIEERQYSQALLARGITKTIRYNTPKKTLAFL